MRLNNQLLLKNSALIDGGWVAGGSERIKVKNPATGKVIESVPKLSEEEINLAVTSAAVAFKTWQFVSAAEKSELLKKWVALIAENELDLAQIMSDEEGKPLTESIQEIKYAASYIDWFAEEAKRIEGDILPAEGHNRIYVTQEPVGVCGLITPWNFPAAMLTRKIAPALAAGCTVVAKPSEETPFSALALAELANRAGIPRGVINMVTGDAAMIGKIFTSNPQVRKISFTGSTKVGELLKSQALPNHQKTSMELGGNAPFVVFADADLAVVTQGLAVAKFRNTGQTCIAANRVLVEKKILSQVVEAVRHFISELIIGDAYQDGVNIGPLINEKAVAKVDDLVQDAVRAGAELVVGGKKSSLGANFYEPTLLTGVTPEMRIFNEEIFGPVVAISTFAGEDEALKLANATPYGLASYFFTQDAARISRFAYGLQYGMVGVNTGVISYASLPFGGEKHSGEGREGSRYGIREYLKLKATVIAGASTLPL